MTIAYSLHGNGPEHVLVMHDWNGDHSNYDGILPYLDGATFTYAFVDLRGYGASSGISGQYTVAEIAGDCLEVADELGWQRFHVMGHSMTGMATQRIALDAFSRVKSAVAVCPISAAGSPMDEENWGFFSSTIENDDAFRGLIKFVTGELSDQWAEVKLRQNRATTTPDARSGYLTMFSKTNFSDEVRGLETPFLVVVGEHDAEGLNESAMQDTFLAWHPNAEVVVIPNVGHYPMQESPPCFAALVEGFLSKHVG
jgi:3-oxoadipate enol-lactonase